MMVNAVDWHSSEMFSSWSGKCTEKIAAQRYSHRGTRVGLDWKSTLWETVFANLFYNDISLSVNYTNNIVLGVYCWQKRRDSCIWRGV